MMKAARIFMVLALTGMLATAMACHKGPGKPADLKVFSCESLDNLVQPDLVMLDNSVFTEGKGAIKVTTEVPMTIPLFNVPYPEAEGAKLIYRAKLKAERFGGDAYLQMVLEFPNGGRLTSQNYAKAIHGTSDWVTKETTASVRLGQKVSSASLNLVIAGQGTIWIDDVHLIRAPDVAEEK